MNAAPQTNQMQEGTGTAPAMQQQQAAPTQPGVQIQTPGQAPGVPAAPGVAAHPSTQINIPQVISPTPDNPSPMPGSPQVQYQQTAPGQNPQTQVTRQPTTPTAPAAPAAPADLTLQQGAFGTQVSDNLLQNVLDIAESQGVSQDNVHNFAEQTLQELAVHHGSIEAASIYAERHNQLVDALEEQYGERGAETALQQISERILAHGGQELLDEFGRNPEMLAPANMKPYMQEGGGGNNPYKEFLQGGRPATQGGYTGGVPTHLEQQPAIDPAQATTSFNQMWGSQDPRQYSSPEWGQKVLELAAAKHGRRVEGGRVV